MHILQQMLYLCHPHKMSKALRTKLNVDEVNKKILAKPSRVHPDHEFLGPDNKYRDEDYEIYKQKREEFYEGARKYQNLNQAALLNKTNKLDTFSDGILRYNLECDILAKDTRCSDEPNVTGLVLRKRTIRPIHQDNIEKVAICSLEPWFKRYLKLCKFVYAARTIILKNRLLKNLAILKELNKEAVAVYEAGHRKYENVSYAQIFEKFM